MEENLKSWRDTESGHIYIIENDIIYKVTKRIKLATKEEIKRLETKICGVS